MRATENKEAENDDLTWPEQFPRICQLAEIMLCIGLSCGTMGEIVWTKWVGGPPVVVIEPLISGIPPRRSWLRPTYAWCLT